ncbi:Nucleotidyltransferase [Irpex rosettiformis]|uniref:Nucleotidyltransferase n=1 Tax=Irpex rosettiformis TaxID=378272 RepID=A0ACB8TZJ2_9APHY|nr:Nucleotidyltransferase [Irpex rosettiformis]
MDEEDMERTAALHETKGTPEDKWRVVAYQKMLGPIRAHPKRIESEEEARGIRGVGDKTAKKIMEIIRTGGLRRISYERTEDVQTVIAFQGIYGVGQKTAYQWYANGCRSLSDVRAGKFGVKLSSAQRIGLKFYSDIKSRMPRNEAKEIFGFIKTIALQMDPHLYIEIMGSYRRGKDTCGDIDILITRPTSDGKTHVGILARLIDELHARNVITEHLTVPEKWDDLELVYRGLCRRGALGKRRRIDFLTVPYASRGAALLYYTFNRSMRLKANKMGYSLNQRGLYKDVIRDPSNRQKKIHNGTLMASETEREIFDILGVPWQEPHERVRS